jgi:3-oxoacyl-[acyl-carrier-protein] synthase-3
MSQTRLKIVGLGTYVPEKVLTNKELEKMVDTTNEWIMSRTGIAERHIAAPQQATSDLCYEASLAALKQANLTAKDLDLIIVATISPDMIFPSTACVLQRKLEAPQAAAFDVNAACSGFVYALITASAFIESGMYKNILVVGAEVLSRFIDWSDRATCVLFGDGAGAAVVQPSQDGTGLIAQYLGADGSGAELLKMPGGGSACPPTAETVQNKLHTLRMDGKEVFKLAVRGMTDAIQRAIAKAGLTVDQIDCLIPHQANMRIISAVQERSGIPMEKVFINLHKYGNMSGASTPVALAEAVAEGKIKKGSNVVIAAFGSGLTWGACVFKW